MIQMIYLMIMNHLNHANQINHSSDHMQQPVSRVSTNLAIPMSEEFSLSAFTDYPMIRSLRTP